MPGALLAQAAATGSRPRRTPWTVAGSCLAHAVVVAAVLVLPAVGPLTIPPFDRPLIVVLASPVAIVLSVSVIFSSRWIEGPRTQDPGPGTQDLGPRT